MDISYESFEGVEESQKTCYPGETEHLINSKYLDIPGDHVNWDNGDISKFRGYRGFSENMLSGKGRTSGKIGGIQTSWDMMLFGKTGHSKICAAHS